MSWPQLLTLATSTVTATVALLGIYPVYRRLQQADRNLRFQVFRDVMAMLEDSKHEREQLERKAAEDPDFDVLRLPEAELGPYLKLIRDWDKLGVLVKHGVVPVDFIMDFYSRPIVQSWIYLGPLVEKQRKLRNQAGHRSKFQMLARKARDYRRKKYPDQKAFDDPDLTAWKETWKLFRFRP